METWGAQGGSYNSTYHGGYGGYSVGYVKLNEGDKLYINVGGSGKSGNCYGGGGGGSSYIGNSLLSDEVMYCYSCTTSTATNTKTISTACNEATPTENCAKKGNGYAKITLQSIN